MSRQSLDVLIVQRESLTAGAIASALQERGHYVRVAYSVEEALALPKPDALVCDAEPGGLTGLELLGWYARDGAVRRRIVVPKRCKVVLDAAANSGPELASMKLDEQPALDDDQLRALWHCGRRIEKHLGPPLALVYSTDRL